jgi:imidazoleglycerol-phosphate dehydratase
MKRKADFSRKTKETDISVEIELFSGKESLIESGVPFFDHMLSSLSRHGRFSLKLDCSGDTHIDDHHTVEDIGICIGSAFKKVLGEKEGIRRFGDAIIPMDDALTLVAVDISGRPYFRYEGTELSGSIKKYSEELTIEFMKSFSAHAGINLHIRLLHGENRHHMHESIFKALGVALSKACEIDPFLEGKAQSTKGTLS